MAQPKKQPQISQRDAIVEHNLEQMILQTKFVLEILEEIKFDIPHVIDQEIIYKGFKLFDQFEKELHRVWMVMRKEVLN